jgi:hypothetical protein
LGDLGRIFNERYSSVRIANVNRRSFPGIAALADGEGSLYGLVHQRKMAKSKL